MIDTPDSDSQQRRRLVFVTGPSGAGRTTAINALEDLGYETIANMPLTLIPRLLEGPPLAAPAAVGISPRTRGFSAGALLRLAEQMEADYAVDFTLVYLDCAPGSLLRRYSETRRRHPAAPDGPPAEGVAREIAILEPLRQHADLLLNTSDLSPHELGAEIRRWFAGEAGSPLAISLQSFSYRRGVPRGLDIVLDCRFLRNPHWDETLRPRDGRDPKVAAHIRGDERFAPFMDRVFALAELLLPAHSEEGKAHLAIGFGCTGGRHRSVMVAETFAQMLAQKGWRVSKRHRELDDGTDGGARPKPG